MKQQHVPQIALVDNYDLTRNGIEIILTRQLKVEQGVNAYRNIDELEQDLEQQAVDVLLLDDDLPTVQDISAILRRLGKQYPAIRTIVISSSLSSRYVRRALESGAKGFIYKQDRLEDTLLVGIKIVLYGDIYLSPRIAALPYVDDIPASIGTLRPRDLEVLRLLARGLSVKEIAKLLNVESHTVYRSRTRLKRALHVMANEQLVDAARTQGLLA